jgi:hypothetical protein
LVQLLHPGGWCPARRSRLSAPSAYPSCRTRTLPGPTSSLHPAHPVVLISNNGRFPHNASDPTH